MNTTTSGQIGSVGKMVLSLENPPWDSLYRAVIGYFVTPACLYLLGGRGTPWKLFVFFLAILVALRIVPGIIRRALPFSRAVKTVWADRRTLARRYDSYQWRKLFGLGLGWLTYLLVSGEGWSAAQFMAGGCLASGALGLVFWHGHSKRLATQAGSAAHAPVSA